MAVMCFTLCVTAPWLRARPGSWLEDKAGRSQRVAASELTQRVRELRNVPALVVLASCQSAGGGDARTSDAGALAAPRTKSCGSRHSGSAGNAERCAIATMTRFTAGLLPKLQRDGQIDRAVAAARGEVRGRDDWYVPVLSSDCGVPSLCRRKGILRTRQRTHMAAAVLRQIQNHGSDPWPGSQTRYSAHAGRLRSGGAETFPLSDGATQPSGSSAGREFLAINQKAEIFPQNELISYLRSDLLERYRDEVPEELRERKENELPRIT